MAQPQVFDIGAMHKVGYASAGGIRRYKEPRQASALERFAFQFLGNQVTDYVKSARDRRSAFRDLNEIQSGKMAATIAEDPFTKNEDVAGAIQEFSNMRDEGQRLVSKYHGFAKSKKYKKGVAMMNQAQASLENLQGDLQSRLMYKNKARSLELNGTFTNADGDVIEGEWDASNGAKIDNRTMALMTGELDKSFVVNRETGRLELLEENWDDVEGIGVLTPEERGDPKITRTPWNELKLNKIKDKTKMFGLSTAAMELGSGYGTNGIEWSNTLQTGIYDQARQQLGGLGRDGFKSWFFGGTHYDFADGGKTFTTPAGAFIEEKYGFEPGTPEYEGALDRLKDTDLDEGDLYKEFAVEHYVDVAKHHHEIGKAAFDKKNAKEPKVLRQQKWEFEAIQEQQYANSWYGDANVKWGKDGAWKYDNKGDGTTDIYRRIEVDINANNPDKESNMQTKYQKVKGLSGIPTNEALEHAGLGGILPEGYYESLYPSSESPNASVSGFGTGDWLRFKTEEEISNADKANL